MKSLLIACLISGCVVSSNDSEVNINYTKPTPNESGEIGSSKGYTDQCGNPERIISVIAGQAHWVEVPSLCNMGPNKDTGDPYPNAKKPDNYNPKEMANKNHENN